MNVRYSMLLIPSKDNDGDSQSFDDWHRLVMEASNRFQLVCESDV